MKLVFAAAALAALTAGCATTERVWVRQGSTEQEFYMDRGLCQAQAFGVSGVTTFQAALVFASCMRGKGWESVERPKA